MYLVRESQIPADKYQKPQYHFLEKLAQHGDNVTWVLSDFNPSYNIMSQPIYHSIKKKIIWILLFAILTIHSIFLFWNLGLGSLQPWDEAWYAAISRNIIRSGQVWVLSYNQNVYFDHPPLGFQLGAISQFVFGESSFFVRLPEAIISLLSVILIFFTAKKLSSDWAGLWAAVILMSSRWFLFRSRTGNFDVLLLFTQLLVVFLAVQNFTSKEKPSSRTSEKILWLTWFALGISLLAKSLISLQLLPVVLIVSIQFWLKYSYKLREKRLWISLAGCLLALILPLLPWIVANWLVDREAFFLTQQKIGLRSGTDKSLNLNYLQTMWLYFHSAVHRWFKLILLGYLASFFLLITKQRKIALLLMILSIFIAAPYLISEKTEIWHLIPLAGVAALSAAVLLDQFLQHYLKSWLKHARIVLTGTIIFFASLSYRDYWREFISQQPFPSDYEKISRHVKHKNITLYITSDAYFPAVVYYADLENARVKYLSDNEDVQICQRTIKDDIPLQIVARYGDWVMSKMGDEVVSVREGELVLIELSKVECEHYLVAAKRVN